MIEPSTREDRILLTRDGKYLGGTSSIWSVDRAVAELLERAGLIAVAPQQDQARFRDPSYRSTGKLHDADLQTAVAEARSLVASSREDQIRKMLLNALEAS